MSEQNKKIEEGIEKARVHLQSHGGDVELVEITDDAVVKVRLRGACAGCPGAQATLRNVVESFVREVAPDIKGIENVG